MPPDRTVLEHLLEGRDALVLEVKRLTSAIEELDSVIGRIGGAERRVDGSVSHPAVVDDAVSEPVPPVEVETVNPRVTPAKKVAARRGAAKAAPARARRAPAKQSTRPAAQPPKSIRVHVLEMLAAENRDFGLAEIIDRIHAEGIQAHDDAVRSITIKLMKDGRVERVGRGLYRLAGRNGAPAPTQPSAPAGAAAGYVPPLDLGQSWQRPGS